MLYQDAFSVRNKNALGPGAVFLTVTPKDGRTGVGIRFDAVDEYKDTHELYLEISLNRNGAVPTVGFMDDIADFVMCPKSFKYCHQIEHQNLKVVYDISEMPVGAIIFHREDRYISFQWGSPTARMLNLVTGEQLLKADGPFYIFENWYLEAKDPEAGSATLAGFSEYM